ncbi:MAG: proteasome accessory factor PafA2 family protein [Mobiluncus sp.]|uniref:proteasome accessory factor PafA2 family protein n=1 Tax=Mobiluncus sp. TaxID=47293 RepID=UPI00258611FE|nr:proteasome accessory factor PafA2 family protein [Mobiluncus sp.]MCI6584376.1 proteasome accessory factor PafA2 family protein [Mobiluncus sp.]
MNQPHVIGLETEFGVMPASPMESRFSSPALAVATAKAVRAWQSTLRPDGRAIAWDWAGENPLQDLRGTHLERASAHPSLLTDDPHAFAPSGDTDRPVEGTTVDRGELGDLSSPMMTNVVMTNGGRFYVDHAHPEYSSPEVLTSLEAVTWDVAGEHLARVAMECAAKMGHDVVLYKNNTDSKGSSYGSHENYQVARAIPFETLRDYLVPFLATRPVICGAGRVGLGQKSEKPGFQISQRADFIADLVGLQTTFNRPIVNTRDEPHAGSQWRRFHVINGDANRFQGSILAKVASTRAWLAALEIATKYHREFPLQGLFFTSDPVEAVWQISRDIDFETKLPCNDGIERSSVAWQLEAAERTGDFLTEFPEAELADDALKDAATWIETAKMLNGGEAEGRVEWVAKRALLAKLASRLRGGWEDPKLAALDIQWADLRKGHSPVDKLQGYLEEVVGRCAVIIATVEPPDSTRATVRGQAVKSRKDLIAASWDSLVVDDSGQWRRLTLGEPAATLAETVGGERR